MIKLKLPRFNNKETNMAKHDKKKPAVLVEKAEFGKIIQAKDGWEIKEVNYAVVGNEVVPIVVYIALPPAPKPPKPSMVDKAVASHEAKKNAKTK